MNYTIQLETEQNKDSPISIYSNTETEPSPLNTTYKISQLMWDKDGELIKEQIH